MLEITPEASLLPTDVVRNESICLGRQFRPKSRRERETADSYLTRKSFSLSESQRKCLARYYTLRKFVLGTGKTAQFMQSATNLLEKRSVDHAVD